MMWNTYDEWKSGSYLDDEIEDAEEICATCAEPGEMTHVSPLGERICRRCGESDDWLADGMEDPVAIPTDAVTRICRFRETCSCCGRKFGAAEWSRLQYVGIQEAPGMSLELRNCSCGSTIALVLADATGGSK